MMPNAVALITGTSSGIGRAAAELLARRGFRVFGTVRRLDGTAAPEGVELVRLDVRDASSVQAAVAAVLSSAAGIDVLVNNAGVGIYGAIEEVSVEEAQGVFEANFFGALRVISAVLPHMRERRRGRIVNVGSIAGFMPMPFEAIYCASKHALAGLSESLDHEVRPFGVRSVLVQPGYIRTEIVRNTVYAKTRLNPYDTDRRNTGAAVADSVTHGDDPLRVAEAILHAATASSPRLRYLAGRGAGRFALLRRFAPNRIFDAGLRRHFRLQ